MRRPYYYAQVDGNDIVYSTAQLHSEVIQDDMIEIDWMRTELNGKRYDRNASTPGNPVFVDVPQA